MADSGEEAKPTFCQKFGSGCSSFGNFLYNSESGLVMGRTGQSWAKIGLFYLVFYGFLAGFFSAMLAVFLTTVERPEDGGKPKLTQYIENKPGLTRLDQSFLLENYDSAANDSSYVKAINNILYGIGNDTIYDGACPTSGPRNSSSSKPCFAPVGLYGDCEPEKLQAALKNKKPCVFIKINKVFGWTPKGNDFLKLNCEGTAFVKVFPEGFLLAGFPYKGDKGHQLPFVAVQVDAAAASEVECTLDDDNNDIEVSSSFNPARSYGKILIGKISAK